MIDVYYITLILISAFLFAFEEFCEWKEGKATNFIWDVKEHWVSVPQRTSLILAGYFYPFGFSEILFMIGLYWLCTDGFMNKLKGRKFFDVSSESGNPLEKLNIVKFSLVVIGIILIIIKIL